MPARKQNSRKTILFILGLLLFAGLLYLYGEQWLRRLLLYLSGAGWARRMVTGFPLAWRVASRFVAGETLDDAIRASRTLSAAGISTAVDFLGESVHDPAESEAARDQILLLLDRIEQENLDAYVSVKLSQLGVNLSEEIAVANLRVILARAKLRGLKVRIDMEDSPLLETTLRIYRQLRDIEGFENVGVVIQAYLYRSEADVQQLAMEGAWVRLVKGAYLEPPDIAFPVKADTDANFVRLAQLMLSRENCTQGARTAIATHDAQMVQATIDFARANEIPNSCYEFQMLYGIRRELQESLVAQGYNVRVYVPYGTAWYPYFMRRLAERPANLWFFISNLLRG